MIGQLHRDAGDFDFDVGEARSAWATTNANELLYTRRTGRAMFALVLLSFCWTEREPAHVDSYLMTSRCQRRSRTEWAVDAVCLVGPDGDNSRRRNLECDWMVVLVDKDVDLDSASVLRTGTWNVYAEGRGKRYLNSKRQCLYR
jgi:hypothetical protein